MFWTFLLKYCQPLLPHPKNKLGGANHNLPEAITTDNSFRKGKEEL